MQNAPGTDGIAKSYENLHDHSQQMRVKAWVEIQAGNLEEAEKLLFLADKYDRMLVKVLARNESIWKKP